MSAHELLPAAAGVADLPGRPCSAAAALAVVGERWSLLALREITFGNRRFNEIARNTGAPRDRLAARLKALVEGGVLERREYQTSPSRSEYHLTAAGRDLGPVLRALVAWGDAWLQETPPVRFVHVVTGPDAERSEHPYVAAEHCATCGQAVTERELRARQQRAGWDRSGPLG